MTYRVAIVMTEPGFANFDHETEILNAIDAQVHVQYCYTVDEVIAFCRDADAIIVNHSPFTREVIAQLKKCKVIVRYGIGYDNIDIQSAAEYGIPVVNIPDYGIQEVADHALSLMLSTIRKIPEMNREIRQGNWNISPLRPIIGLRDKVVGLAGFGNIAREVAQRLQGFHFKVVAYDPYVSAETFANYEVEAMNLDQLIAMSDVISIHLPLFEQTRHFFNRAIFQKMKQSAYLINTSRGALINTDDLVEALDKGWIAGAGLDVFEQEPLPLDHPLFGFKQCVLTAHTAWYSEDSMVRLQQYAALEVKRVLTGESPKHIVNKITK